MLYSDPVGSTFTKSSTINVITSKKYVPLWRRGNWTKLRKWAYLFLQNIVLKELICINLPVCFVLVVQHVDHCLKSLFETIFLRTKKKKWQHKAECTGTCTIKRRSRTTSLQNWAEVRQPIIAECAMYQRYLNDILLETTYRARYHRAIVVAVAIYRFHVTKYRYSLTIYRLGPGKYL